MEVWDALKAEAFPKGAAKHRSLTVGLMHRLHGETPGRRCGECVHLVERGRYFKCDLAKVSSSPATDWRKSWPSCGRFGERQEDG
jgi:hypothetical protein